MQDAWCTTGVNCSLIGNALDGISRFIKLSRSKSPFPLSKAPQHGQNKGKGKGLDTCYRATYMSQTRDQQRFTISEVAADWHEPMVQQRIM